MVRVVYNACHGGFSLSRKAREMMACAGVESAQKHLDKHSGGSSRWFDYHAHDLQRHDERLVSVVQALGSQANGWAADLRIAEVSGPYRIDEYDGAESVETPNSYEWVTP